jgi:regulator of sirC expression with transglutaminase-like and TPR domain
MAFRFVFIVFAVSLLAPLPAFSSEFSNIQLESQIEALFVGNRDLVEIKLTIDRMVDPAVNVEAGLKDIGRMESELDRVAERETTSTAKLAALKRYVYEAGPWNGGKPFQYDMTDPMGLKPENRLLTDYLADRQGNCVSMPVLFMILGQHIGLKMTLAAAPLHMFVKFTDDDGREWNLETTSGAGFSRDSYYRKNSPMSDERLRQAFISGVFPARR